MENCIKVTTSEIWTECFTSAGLAGTLALCSGTLTGMETDRVKAINNFAVANSYVRPHMVQEFLWILTAALTRTSGAND